MWGKEKLGPILRKHGYAASNAEAPGGSLGLRLCDRSALRRTAGSKVSTRVIDCQLTMSKGAVNGEPVGKATCGGRRQTQSPRTVSPCKLNLRPDHHGRRLGAGGETISR